MMESPKKTKVMKKTKEDLETEDAKKIKLCQDFAETCLPNLIEDLRRGQHHIIIDFSNVSKFNPDLASDFLDEPQETIKALTLAVEYMDIGDTTNIQFGFIKLPKGQEVSINRIRHKHLGKLIQVKGVVLTRTNTYPQIASCTFECPSCANEVTISQNKKELKEPKICGCGIKGTFILKHRMFKDTITISLDELPERLIGPEQPSNIRVVLQNKLCNKDQSIHLGARADVVGYLEAIPKRNNHSRDSTSCDYLFHALNYQNLDNVSFNTKISKEEQALFDEIKNNSNPAKFISNLIFHDIHGCTIPREAAIYQQFCGTTWKGKRDFIHILFYGSPGTAKTDIASRVAKINLISRFSSGPNISNVGLTASAKNDKLTGNWTAVAGLLPMCNNGLAVIDEIEKMKDEDKKGLHTPMEHGVSPLNKAGINAKLLSNTSILATSNPKVYDEPLKVYGNLELPSPIIDRFDLIFTFEDKFDQKRDFEIARKLTSRATFEGSPNISDSNLNTFELNDDTFEHNGHTFPLVTLKKYVYLCKKFSPKLSVRAQSTIQRWYVGLRKMAEGLDFNAKRPTPRSVEGILRLARAITRSKQKDTVTIKELQLAKRYFDKAYDKTTSPMVSEESVEESEPKEEEDKKKK